MRYAKLSLLILLLLCVPALAEVKVRPLPTQSIGIATSETMGRWMVFRAAPFGIVPSEQVTLSGEHGCLWVGAAGVYTAVLMPTDPSISLEYGTVTIGGNPGPGPGPGPGPDPEPDPTPTPGARKVVVVAEEDNQTVAREIAINVLRDYVRANAQHSWSLYDPDMKDSSGNTPAFLTEINQLVKNGPGMPALLIFAKGADGKDVVSVFAFPTPGTSAATGKLAGEKAVKILKDAGG